MDKSIQEKHFLGKDQFKEEVVSTVNEVRPGRKSVYKDTKLEVMGTFTVVGVEVEVLVEVGEEVVEEDAFYHSRSSISTSYSLHSSGDGVLVSFYGETLEVVFGVNIDRSIH